MVRNLKEYTINAKDVLTLLGLKGKSIDSVAIHTNTDGSIESMFAEPCLIITVEQ